MTSDEIMREEEVVKRKVNYFYKNNSSVHIIFHDGTWENGSINELGSDFLMLKLNEEGRRKNGMGIIPIFFMEIKDIEELEVKE